MQARLTARIFCLCPASLPLSSQTTIPPAQETKDHFQSRIVSHHWPSGWALSFPVRFKGQWSRCWKSVQLSWLETLGGMWISQTLNTAVMLLSIMVARTATAKLRENKNFNCIRIMGNQSFHYQLNVGRLRKQPFRDIGSAHGLPGRGSRGAGSLGVEGGFSETVSTLLGLPLYCSMKAQKEHDP